MNEVLNLDREQRKAIDRMLVQGKSKAAISREFGVSEDTLRNYEEVHMGGRAIAGWDRSLKSHTESLFGELLELADITKQILRSALEDNHRGLSLKAVQQVRNNLETLTRFVLSMEELQMKQNSIVIDQEKEERSAQMIKEGLAALTEEERAEYRRIIIKMLAGVGSHNDGNMEQEDPSLVPTHTLEGDRRILTGTNESEKQELEYRVDQADHSLQPVRTTPRKVDPEPPMRRTNF